MYRPAVVEQCMSWTLRQEKQLQEDRKQSFSRNSCVRCKMGEDAIRDVETVGLKRRKILSSARNAETDFRME